MIKEKLEQVLQLQEQGYIFKEIANKLDTDEKVLRNYMRRNNYTCEDGKYILKDGEVEPKKVEVKEVVKKEIISKPKEVKPEEDKVSQKQIHEMYRWYLSQRNNCAAQTNKIEIDKEIIKDIHKTSINVDRELFEELRKVSSDMNVNTSILFSNAIKLFLEKIK